MLQVQNLNILQGLLLTTFMFNQHTTCSLVQLTCHPEKQVKVDLHIFSSLVWDCERLKSGMRLWETSWSFIWKRPGQWWHHCVPHINSLREKKSAFHRGCISTASLSGKSFCLTGFKSLYPLPWYTSASIRFVMGGGGPEFDQIERLRLYESWLLSLFHL